MLTLCIVLAAVAPVVSDAASAGETDFVWKRKDRAGKDAWRLPAAICDDETFSVRFSLATVDAHATDPRFTLDVDGIAIESNGQNLTFVPGERTVPFYYLRYCLLHDFVFVCEPTRVRYWIDGVEYEPLAKSGRPPRGFALSAEGIDAEIRRLRWTKGDASSVWLPRNTLANGGFEQVSEDYPVGWGTEGFGVGSFAAIADIERVRENFTVDDTVAYEGTRSFRLTGSDGKLTPPLCELWTDRLSNTEYTVSAYVRTDRPGTPVTMSVFEGSFFGTPRLVASRTFAATSAWTRVGTVFRTVTGVRSYVSFAPPQEAGARLWIDAVQVERGGRTTDYVTRRFPEPEYPTDLPEVMDYLCPLTPAHAPTNAPPPRMKRICPRRNSFVVDGKEYFPFGLCHEFAVPAQSFSDYERALDRYARCGFNFIELFNLKPSTDSALLKRVLDAGERRGIKTFLYIGHDAKTQREDVRLVDMVRPVARHPNLLGVGMYDECYGTIPQETRDAAAARVRAALGGEVPVRFSEMDVAVIDNADYSGADIASGDFYEVCQSDPSLFYHYTKRLKDLNEGRTVMVYPMATGGVWHWTRDPTAREILAQAYMAYALEIFGLDWWVGAPFSAAAMEALVQAKRERDAIDPSRFLDGEKASVVCRAKRNGVKFAARLRGDDLLIVAVNIRHEKVRAEWSLRDAGYDSATAEVWFENRTRPVAAGVFVDDFESLERHVYRVFRK